MSESFKFPSDQLQLLGLLAKPFVGTGKISPWYQSVIFREGSAEITDGVRGVHLPFPSPAAFALPADTLFNSIIRTDEPMDGVLRQGRMEFRSGTLRGKVSTLDMSAAPNLSKLPADGEWLSVADGLWDGLRATVYAAPKAGGPEGQEQVAGVLVQPGFVVALDGATAALYPRGQDLGGAMIPRGLIEAVEKTSSDPVGVLVTPSRVYFRLKSGAVAWHLRPAKDYPLSVGEMALQRVRAAEPVARWEERAEFLSALQKLAPFIGNSGVVFRAEPGVGLVLSAEKEGSDVEVTVRAQVRRAAEIRLQPRSLQEVALRATIFGISEGKTPVGVFQAEARNPSLISLVMPLMAS